MPLDTPFRITPVSVFGAKCTNPLRIAAMDSDCPFGLTTSTAGVSVARAKCAADAVSVVPETPS